jgi:exodeoxyribonuclease VII large subunit
VAAAIAGFDAIAPGGPIPRPDLVIVARGGGSIEDLWAFNEEVVVRAVAACTIPIISAVGHETDTTLCDFAADRRAPTPTAAAEMAVPVRGELAALLQTFGSRMGNCARRYRERAGERFHHVARRLPTPDTLLGPQRQRLDDCGERLPRGLSKRLAVARGDLAHAAGALRPRLLATRVERERALLARIGLKPALVTARIGDAATRLESLWRVAQSLNPDLVLRRGYARVEAEGHLVTTADRARVVGAMTLVFADGRVAVRTEEPAAAAAGPMSVAPPRTKAQPKPVSGPSLQPRLL